MTQQIKVVEGDLVVKNAKFSLVVSRFNRFIVDSLERGAIDTLLRHSVAEQNIQIIRVPGAFEIPLAAKRVALMQTCDAIIALGAVIRGSTPHFEYVAGECTKGLSTVSLQYDIPVAYGVLTVDTIEQAVERAGTKAGNKGADAAQSAIEMINVLRKLSKP